MLYREIIATCFQIHTKHIYTLRGQNAELLGALEKLRKATISVMSVCPSAQNTSTPTGRIFITFYMSIFLKICRGNSSLIKI